MDRFEELNVMATEQKWESDPPPELSLYWSDYQDWLYIWHYKTELHQGQHPKVEAAPEALAPVAVSPAVKAEKKMKAKHTLKRQPDWVE